MAKDKQNLNVEDPKRLDNFVAILDLDETITYSNSHYNRITSEITFVPGSLELIKDMYDRGAKIAIISHSVFKTTYAEAALNRLEEMGVENVHYVCLYEVILSELEHAEIHTLSRTEQLIQFNIFDYDSNSTAIHRFEILNKSNDLAKIAEKLVDDYQHKLIDLFGKGVSPKMGSIALKKLGISSDKCKDMNICTIGDAITDVVQARILRDHFKFSKAYGYWLQTTQPEDNFFFHYAKQLCDEIRQEYNTCTESMVSLRVRGVALVFGRQLPEKFDCHEWDKQSELSVESWERTLREAQLKHQQVVAEAEARTSNQSSCSSSDSIQNSTSQSKDKGAECITSFVCGVVEQRLANESAKPGRTSQ